MSTAFCGEESGMLDDFRLIMRFAVPFGDVDMMQHVNNVAYVRWAETMRGEYFARVMGEDINSSKGMIQASINFTYERQLSYRERIAIGIRVSRIGTKSWDFEYGIWSEDHNHRVAHGVTTMVAFNFVENATIEVPGSWREAIAKFEAGSQVIV
jgi:acyl-CoA thioester hydrolase